MGDVTALRSIVLYGAFDTLSDTSAKRVKTLRLLRKAHYKAAAEAVDALTQPFYFYGNSLRIATAQILRPLLFEIMMPLSNGVQRCLRTQQAWNAWRAMMRNTGRSDLVALPPI